MIAYLRKARKIFKARGLSGLYRQLLWKKYLIKWSRRYQEWIAQFDTITESDVEEMRRRIGQMHQRPLISVLMPVYNVDEKWLRAAIESVVDQVYPHWEFCIADDASPKPHLRRVLEEYAAKDERIKVAFRTENGHISAASNSALELTTGEYTVLLDHDDVLARHALFMVAAVFDADPDIDMMYSDEDLIDERGRRYFPKFKPDWSPELLYAMNFVTHLSVYRTSILKKIGGFTVGREGSQDYDLALRFSEEIEPRNIFHIPHILYHWRAIRGSVAFASEEKSYAHERAREALNAHFERKNIDAKAVAGFGELHRTVYSLPNEVPLVSIIVLPNCQDRGRFERSLCQNTEYQKFEIIYAETAADGSAYAVLNEAALSACGSIICFLEWTTVIKDRDWLREVTSLAIQPGVGAVGGKVVFPDNHIKSAGFLLGVGDGVGRSHYRFHKFDLGNFMRLHVTQNFAAVSAEFLTVRKDVFQEAGGFDAIEFPESGADVDLCLRLRDAGFRIVWTPWAEIIQSEPATTIREDDIEKLKSKWPSLFVADPYINPNLSTDDADFSLSFPPRIGKLEL